MDIGTVEHGCTTIPAGTKMENPLRAARLAAEARERAGRPTLRISTKGGSSDANL